MRLAILASLALAGCAAAPPVHHEHIYLTLTIAELASSDPRRPLQLCLREEGSTTQLCTDGEPLQWNLTARFNTGSAIYCSIGDRTSRYPHTISEEEEMRGYAILDCGQGIAHFTIDY